MNYWLLLGGSVAGVLLLSALSRKWCLPARISALIIAMGALIGLGLGLLMSHWNWPPLLMFCSVPAIQLMAYTAAILYRFYRDPERVAPADPAVVVSPADGKVIYIRRCPAGTTLRCDKRGSQLVLDELAQAPLVAQDLWQVGISMVFTDVHVNRAPIAGKIVQVVHRPGKFLSLRNPEAINLNERQTLLLDNGRFQVAIVQIASRLVRQIESYVKQGENLSLGQRIGIIKFGSQVDLFLPVNMVSSLGVKVGDELVAGESVVCRVETQQPSNPEPQGSIVVLPCHRVS